jgi:amino acid adenylation domain-containing protein
MADLNQRIANLSPAKRALADLRLSRAGLRIPKVQRVSPREPAPLSFAQQRLWFLDQLEPENSFYNVPRAIRLRGNLNVEALHLALTELVRRHEVLRTSIALIDGQPMQIIAEQATLELPIIDLSSLTESERQTEGLRLATAEARRPFNLSHAPILRTNLLRLSSDEHILLLTTHHIASDLRSAFILFQELGALYKAYSSNEPSPLPELPIQYVDYAVWQRDWLQGEVLESQLSYWRRQLDGAPSMLELPTDRPRPAAQSFGGAHQELILPAGISNSLRALGREEGMTLFMTLLAAFQVLLSRYSGQQDIVVGSPIAGRTRVEAEGLVGFFVNTLVLRTDLHGNPSFRELLKRVKEVALGAYSHQDVPFEKLVEELQPERTLSHTPLFQVMFLVQQSARTALQLSGLQLNWLEVEAGTANFDLSLGIFEKGDELHCSLEYKTDLFEETTIKRMLSHFQSLLEGVVANPQQRLSNIALLSSQEREQLLVEWNGTQKYYEKDRCLHQLFEEQAASTPDAIALVCEEEQLTYRELNRRANQLAHYLRRSGVGAEVLVGIMVERSIEMVVGLLGILKSGGAYVPFDPTYPPERLGFMVEDAQVSVLLTQERLLERVPRDVKGVVSLDGGWQQIGQESEQNLDSKVTAENAAYVIYTSGSTGKPKGVLGLHRASLNRFSWMWQRFPFEANDVCCQKTSLSFVDSIWEIFGPMLKGIQLVIIRDEDLKDPYRLVQSLADRQVTRIVLVPSLLRVILDAFPDLQQRVPSLKLWVVSGEALPVELSQRFGTSMPESVLINLYGSSEVTADVTCYDTRKGNLLPCVPIGRPIANTQAYILDAHLQPVPVGVAGHLYIGGDNLARGYLRRPDLTVERFIADPFSNQRGARLYMTGDMARYLPGGEIAYLGRSDYQVKIRGQRVELGEIESALSMHEAVSQSLVVSREEADDTRLVAYVATAGEKGSPTVSDLRTHLKNILPEYMIPASFVFLDKLPLTPNGKVDRQSLPEPDQSRPELEKVYQAPCTPVEEILAAIWSKLLRVEQVGIDDNFFELGGHSLLGAQVIARVRDEFRVELPLRALFELPTVAALAKRIEIALRAEEGLKTPPLCRRPRSDHLPLSFSQQRLWFLDQLEPGNPSYNIRRAVQMRGILNVEALRDSIREIVQRHEVLRTKFISVDGKPIQVIADSLDVLIPIIELDKLSEARRTAEAQQLIAEEAKRPFDLAQGPLMRASLLKMAEDDHILLLTMHHIVSDAWSVGVLFRELASLYEGSIFGKISPLPDLPIQYADFAIWQREWLRGEVLEKQLSYWRKQLAGTPAILELSTDRPRSVSRGFKGAKRFVALTEELTNQLNHLSRREGATLFMTLFTVYQILLNRYSSQDDIVVGTPTAGRNWSETEGLIGVFINTLVLRTDLSGDPGFRELLTRVREITLGAYANQDVPFEKLVDDLQIKRDLSYNPLFQVWFVLQAAIQRQKFELPGLTLNWLDLDSESVRHDLQLSLIDTAEGLCGSFEYNTDLFNSLTIDRMIKQFESLLQTVVLHPDMRLSELQRMLDEADKHQQLAVEIELQEASSKRLRNARRKIVSGSQLRGEPGNGTRSNGASVVEPNHQDETALEVETITSQIT